MNELSPVYTTNNVEATFDFVESTFDFVAKNGNNFERVYRNIRHFDKVECCFDIVAVFGNNVERNFVLSTKWKRSEHVQFV